jgi:tripeptide aminopeptidase
MLPGYDSTLVSRFFRYVQVDTQSDPRSVSTPSTAKQKDLGNLLVKELKEMGIEDAEMDPFGYVYATIPSNSDKAVPVICFCAHMDTAPDCTGTGVKPILHRNYDGGDIILPDDSGQVISPAEHPYLKEKIGQDLITASGTTLLGADDKAGIAIIMEMTHYLLQHPEWKHGKIRILFTPDEEIGRGVDHVDLKKLGADFGYTLDGSELGSLDEETFSADGISFSFYGIAAHPGQAKDKLVNALKVGAFFIDSLPKDEWSPETTEGRYGFVHPVRMEGTPEKMTVDFIVRDFATARLAAYENYLEDRAQDAVAKFPGAVYQSTVREQYRNMKEILIQHPQVSEYARQAIRNAGVTVRESAARGGTDGSRLSFLGLPCPNIFTGEMAYHGKQEYVSVQDMEKSVETILWLSGLWESQS